MATRDSLCAARIGNYRPFRLRAILFCFQVCYLYAAYSFALAIALILVAPFYAWKGRRTGRYWLSFRERLGRLPDSLNAMGRFSIWIHAVSVGEALAVRPLLKPLKERFPDLAVFVSTTTETGQLVARRSLGEADGIFFAPFDLRGSVRKALAVVRPRLLVLIETEIWPNLIHEAGLRGARVAVVNGRLSESSFRGYRRAGALVKRVLRGVDLFLMQSEEHARRIRDLGAPAAGVRVLGNLKFDAANAAAASEELAALLRLPSGLPLWVAGSTMPGEEEMILRALGDVRARVGDVALLLAPRHPERCVEVAALVESAGLRCLRRTRLEPGAWSKDCVVLLDTMGELAQVYSLARVVFVGGSLVPAGGHNILEPAMAGKAVVVGPFMQNFREIADAFREQDAFVQVNSTKELAEAISGLLEDEARRDGIGARARALVERNRGAVSLTVDALAGLVA